MSIRITPDNYVAVGQDIIRDPDNFNIDHIIQVRRHLMGYLRNPDRIEFPYLSDLKGLTSKLRDLLLLKLTAQPDGMPYAIANACISQIKRPDALLKLATVDEIELGRHGVIIKKGFNSGVFLPQVATETGWFIYCGGVL